MSEERRWVVVTGATGFLGRPLCSKLQESGATVRAASRTPQAGPWSDFVRVDLPAQLPSNLFAGADVVYHLAGRAHAMSDSRADADLYRDVNVRGTAHVAGRAKDAGVKRFVFMSSVKVFGEPGREVVSENQERRATDPYGASKREAEDALMRLHSPDFQVVVLRPALVYGPGAKGNLDALVRLLSKGRMPPLPRVSNRRSMVGLYDLIDAILLAGCHPRTGGQAYTVTDGAVYSTTRIIEILAAALGISRKARFTIPLPALRVAARVGDAGRRLTGRRLPLDSAMLSRLLENAEYEAVRLREQTGYAPRQDLTDLAEAIVQERA